MAEMVEKKWRVNPEPESARPLRRSARQAKAAALAAEMGSLPHGLDLLCLHNLRSPPQTLALPRPRRHCRTTVLSYRFGRSSLCGLAGNWGTSTGEILAQETEKALMLDEKAPIPEKQGALEDPPQVEENKDNKDATANEEEEKEEKEMTLEEFEKLREEKRKALLDLKTKERKVEVDKDLQFMQPLSTKKGNDDFFIKLDFDKDALKKKENAKRDERAKKV